MSTPDAFVVTAPGRVNVIGGHVDFHDGIVVCAAIDRRIRAQVTRRDDHIVTVVSDRFDGTVEVPAAGTVDPARTEPAWGRLVGAVLSELAARGRPPVGFDAVVSSDLPVGGGLSSSAAFEVLIGRAATAAAEWVVADVELATAAQAAEHRATGVPCGIQDQMASVVGGLFSLDCRTMEVRSLTLSEDAALLVIDSGMPRTLEGSPWSARRAESLAAARALGLDVLRDATADQVADSPVASHVVAEIDRARRFIVAVEDDDLDEAGRLMIESHRSSSQRYGSSTRELDVLVEELVAAGAYGARLTGGGFGGCVVALVPVHERGRISAEVSTAYERRVGIVADAMSVGITSS